MKISFKYEDIKVSIELDTEEVEALGAGITAAVENPDVATQVITEIAERFSVPQQESNEEEPEEDPEQEPDKEAGKFKVPCRTWNHLNDEQKYKFVKNWLRRRKIPFTEEPGYTRSYITYELTLAQLERLQRSMKENFGEDFDTEIKI